MPRPSRSSPAPVSGGGPPDGLLIGTYTAGTGLQRIAGGAAAPAAPLHDASFLTRSTRRAPLLHAVDEGSDHIVTLRFAAEGADVVGVAVTAGVGPCHLALVADDTVLMAACYGSGTVSAHRLGPDGMPHAGVALPAPPPAPTGPHPAQDGPHAHSVLEVGEAVLVADLGTDRVLQYERHGHRFGFERAIPLPPGSGPRDLVRHGPDTVLVLGEHDACVHLIDLAAGCVVASSGATSSPAVGDQAAGMTLRGGVLTVGLRGSDRLATLAVDPAGRPRPLHAAPTGGTWPRHHLVLPGRVLVANERSGSVDALPLGLDGRLGDPAWSIPVPAPAFLLL